MQCDSPAHSLHEEKEKVHAPPPSQREKRPFMRQKIPQSHSELGIKLVAKKVHKRGPLGQVATLGWGESVLFVGGWVHSAGAPILWCGPFSSWTQVKTGEILVTGGTAPEIQAQRSWQRPGWRPCQRSALSQVHTDPA